MGAGMLQVNLISASGKKLRVLVGIIDSGKRFIEVRRSEIIDFSDGERKNWAKWIVVLCWVAGEPLGKTTD